MDRGFIAAPSGRHALVFPCDPLKLHAGQISIRATLIPW
jgi:hypothetical protein